MLTNGSNGDHSCVFNNRRKREGGRKDAGVVSLLQAGRGRHSLQPGLSQREEGNTLRRTEHQLH